VVDDFRRQGGTVVLTTHYMEEAAHLCDRVAIIDHGSLIACDTPAALIARLGADQIVELETKPILDVDSVRSIEGVSDVVLRAQRCVVHVDDVATALPALFALVAQRGLELGHVTVHQPTLEDVFIHLTGKALRDG
jgi:ABC-2 type transport system ATP-binding protein